MPEAPPTYRASYEAAFGWLVWKGFPIVLQDGSYLLTA